jgi:hypothetical protein
MPSGTVTSLPITASLVMSRALDPYHRIRATVGAIFLLSVLTMGLTTMHGPGRHATGVQAGGATVQSVTGVPVVTATVSVAPVPLTATAAAAAGSPRVTGSAPAARRRAGHTP